MADIRPIEKQIEKAMLADRYRLTQQFRAIKQDHDSGKPVDRKLDRLIDSVNRSIALCETRQARAPRPSFDGSLPIHAKREEIAEAIREHQTVVVSGETGSGKSTQLPKICLDIGRGVEGMIGHTQPRRIAARSIANRLAEELGSPLGQNVGFKIRFTDATGPGTYVKLMTDGILLAETQGDRFLNQYDTIILDEAHERSLNIDFLIGYLKRLLARRRDLKLIITSATIDSVRFSRHFRSPKGPAPVVEVSGRNYPVEVRHRPIEADEDTEEPDLEQAVVKAVQELARIDNGDILVFMPTERHIHDTAKALRAAAIPGDYPGKATEIIPLYARLPANEQQRVFSGHGHRRIVIATNVAESSLTVPGIRYVIDPGTARISRYSPRSKTQRLPIEAVSQASADQRKGRCGRLGPGICIRLFSEEDYSGRDQFTPPEILRSNLASVILTTKALKLGNVESFPFLEPPKSYAVRDGYNTLFELGAMDDRRQLTELGRRLGRIPVDPRIGRMILAAGEENCLSEVLIIASALEVRDPRDRPLEKQQQADQRHAQFAHQESDFLGYLNMWDFFHQLKDKLSRSQLRKACRQNFLSYNRMREWLDVHRQLLQLVAEAGLKRTARRDEYASIHRAILTGLLSNLAFRTEAYEYTVAGGGKAHLWPGSSLFSKKPTWVIAAELVETSRRYLRTCARIDPGWIEPIAEHLVKRTYSEPHWQRSTSSAAAYEKVSLFGLTVVPRRRVQYGPINPKHARELLIQHGLVEGDLDTEADFLIHNQELLEEMEQLQAKLRRHDLLLGEWSQYEFYDRLLPDDVWDGPRLAKWRQKVQRENPRLLYMSASDLISEPTDGSIPAEFPDAIPLGENELPLDYRFEPGAEQDGVTVTVPLETLNQLDRGQLGWLVPGLLERKVVALIKSLPKPIRRRLVPAPDTARKVVGELRFGDGNLLAALAAVLGRIAGEQVPVEAFDEDKLPDDLKMCVRVVNAEGETLAEGRELDTIRRQLAAEASASFSALDDTQWRRDGILSWDFGELPEQIDVASGSVSLKAFPMLVDEADSVSLRLADSPERAARQTRCALRRLFILSRKRELESQVSWLPDLQQMLLYAASIENCNLQRQLVQLIAERAFMADGPLPQTEDQFHQQAKEGRRRIAPAVQEVANLVGPLFEAYHKARLAAERITASTCQYVATDARSQLDQLTGPDFLTNTPWEWLRHYRRYFRAIELRLDKLSGGSLSRDRKNWELLEIHLDAYRQKASQHEQMSVYDPELVRFRWMLEEYRVSLFAQELGTSIPVSAKRLDRQWEQVRE